MKILDALPVDDPVLLSAPLAREAAHTLCYHDDGQGQNCAWYHGVLPYMRFLKTAVDPSAHGAFYATYFNALAKLGGFDRVLVSGAADYCMAAQVIQNYRGAAAEADITVVDQCETPLMLSRWYGGRVDAKVETVSTKILEYRPHRPFDVITTHCFLGYFDPEERQQVVRSWYNWLRPGGKAVIVNGIRRGFKKPMNRFSPEQSEEYVEQVIRQASARQDDLDVDAKTLGAWAKTYSQNFWNFPIYSEDDLKDMFETAGFAIEYIHTAIAEGQDRQGLKGPGVLGAVEYTSIVATRP